MESTTQPILCCIGESVAGLPTQFMLERAFSQTGLDWRVITVEIGPGNFPTAMAGMEAMRFSALRFFPTVSQLVPDLLDVCSPATRFVGHATSASWNGGAYEVWDHCGHALRELVMQRHSVKAELVLLLGDGRLQRSVWAASQHQVHDALRIIWVEAPVELKALLGGDGTVESPNHRIACWAAEEHGSQRHAVLESLEQLRGQEIDLYVVGQLPADNHAATIDELDSSQPIERSHGSPGFQFASLNFIDNDALAWNCGDQPESAGEQSSYPPPSAAHPRLPNWLCELPGLDISSLHRISPVDLAVAAEAHDYRAWTGQSIDRRVLREAYEEFCDF
jgi:hypothetical protein